MFKNGCLELIPFLEGNVKHGREYGKVFVDGLLHVAVSFHVKHELVYQAFIDVIPFKRVFLAETFKYHSEAFIGMECSF